MNKRLIIFGVLLAALLLSAVSPWPATLWVYNQTGDNIYITLKYRGEQKYFLTATPKGNSDTYRLSTFDITRRVYSATVTACATTVSGTMDLRTNLWLRFTPCDAMKQWWTPKYIKIDRGQEKPNFYEGGDYNVNVKVPLMYTKVVAGKQVWWVYKFAPRDENLYLKLWIKHRWYAPFQFVY